MKLKHKHTNYFSELAHDTLKIVTEMKHRFKSTAIS
jgi:hypothetical protein